MTGQELFYGLSFVDEKFIAEAADANFRRNTPWTKVLSVAACLCILIVGAFAMEHLGYKGAKEEAAAPAEPLAAPAAPAATEAAPRQESAVEEALPETAEVPAGELQHIPSATLRIIDITEAGYTAVVEEVSDEPNLLEAGMELTVVIDPEKVPGSHDQVTVDTESLTVGTAVAAEDGAYDAGTNTLYVADLYLLR